MAVQRRARDGRIGFDAEVEVLIPNLTELGDFMVTSIRSNVGDTDYPAPAGWTHEIDVLRPGNDKIDVWYKVADEIDAAGGNSYIFEGAAKRNNNWIVEVFYEDEGKDLTIEASAGFVDDVADNTLVCPDVTSLTDNAFLLCVVSVRETTAITANSPLTTSYFNQANNSNTASGFEELGVAGSTGQKSFNSSVSKDSLGVSLVIGVLTPSVGFPVVEGRTQLRSWPAETTHTVPLPAGEPGELLLILASQSAGSSMTAPGFVVTPLPGQGGDTTYVYKIADGNEGSSVTFTLDASAGFFALVWRISGWEEFEFGPVESTDTDTPDPPELIPSWGLDSVLWLAYMMRISGTADSTITGYPAGFSQGRATGDGRKVGGAEREEEAATMDPGPFTDSAIGSSLAGTIGVKPGLYEPSGVFSLLGEANLGFTGRYEPTVFVGEFSLTGEADLVFDPFFFVPVEGSFSLDGEAALVFAGTHVPPVFSSWFSLLGEAVLSFSGTSEVYGEADLTGEAWLVFLGVEAKDTGQFVLHGVANLVFTGVAEIPGDVGFVTLTGSASLGFDGAHTAPIFRQRALLRAVASLSAEGTFLPITEGRFDLTGEANFGMWTQVPLLPGTGSSIIGDRATPTKVWSLEDPSIVIGEDDPTKVRT